MVAPLVTTGPRDGDEPSTRVILSNGGVPYGQRQGKERFWIALTGRPASGKKG